MDLRPITKEEFDAWIKHLGFTLTFYTGNLLIDINEYGISSDGLNDFILRYRLEMLCNQT